jgi:hypothetical protein
MNDAPAPSDPRQRGLLSHHGDPRAGKPYAAAASRVLTICA